MLILTVESFASTALGMAVGSLAPSVEAAIAIAPSVMVIFIVFGGLYVVNTPSYLQWVPSVSLIRWAYEALCINEFTDLKLKPDAKFGPRSYATGEQVLEGMGIKSTLRGALLAQTSIIVANWMFTYFSLLRQKPDFERIQSSIKQPGEEENGGGSTGGVVHSTGSSQSSHRVVSESSSKQTTSRDKAGSGSGLGGSTGEKVTLTTRAATATTTVAATKGKGEDITTHSRSSSSSAKTTAKTATATALPFTHRGGFFTNFGGSTGSGSGKLF